MLLDNFVPETVTAEQKRDYHKVSANWTYLSSFLSRTELTPELVGILIRIELEGKNREDIIDRLLSRLGSLLNKQLKTEGYKLWVSKNRQ